MAPERLGGDWRPRGPQRILPRGGCDALGARGSRMRQSLLGRSRGHPECRGHPPLVDQARGSPASDPADRCGALWAPASLPSPVQRRQTGMSRGERRPVFRCGGELDGQLDVEVTPRHLLQPSGEGADRRVGLDAAGDGHRVRPQRWLLITPGGRTSLALVFPDWNGVHFAHGMGGPGRPRGKKRTWRGVGATRLPHPGSWCRDPVRGGAGSRRLRPRSAGTEFGRIGG
jgi:hypothetical protein